MNPKAQAFIEKAKHNDLQQRNKHLISLGIVDEDKTTRIESFHLEGVYDNEKGKWYKEVFVAEEVTDDEYAEICKYAVEVKSSTANIEENSAEKTLSTTATFILWVGIIGSVILLISAIVCNDSYSSKELVLPLLLSVIPVLLSSIILWAVLNVLCNISNNIKAINKDTKRIREER